MFNKKVVFILVQLFSNLALAQMPTYEEFLTQLKIGNVSCRSNQFMQKTGLKSHSAYQNLPDKKDFKSLFLKRFPSVIYEGLKRIYVLNPAITEHVLSNLNKFEVDYFCDYSMLSKGAAAFAMEHKFMLFGKRAINIGLATLLMVGEGENYDPEDILNQAWANRLFLHEFLHLYLAVDHNLSPFPHSRSSALIAHWDDIVYSLSNYAYRIPVLDAKPYPKPDRTQILSELQFIQGISTKNSLTREKKSKFLLPSPHVFSLEQCLTAFYAEVTSHGTIEVKIPKDSLDQRHQQALSLCSDVDYSGALVPIITSSN
jgi:hypothetical protein